MIDTVERERERGESLIKGRATGGKGEKRVQGDSLGVQAQQP
jgi:hypothetical protein